MEDATNPATPPPPPLFSLTLQSPLPTNTLPSGSGETMGAGRRGVSACHNALTMCRNEVVGVMPSRGGLRHQLPSSCPLPSSCCGLDQQEAALTTAFGVAMIPDDCQVVIIITRGTACCRLHVGQGTCSIYVSTCSCTYLYKATDIWHDLGNSVSI